MPYNLPIDTLMNLHQSPVVTDASGVGRGSFDEVLTLST